MKTIKNSSFIKLISIAIFMSISQLLAAQDTIIHVPVGIVDGKGALYDAIIKDVDDNGDRLHPNATYRLTRGQVYPVPGMYLDFDITIDAADGEERPPMIIPEKNVAGGLPYAIISHGGDNTMTFEDIIFSGICFDKSIVDWGMELENGKVVIENCIFNGFDQGAIGGQGTKHYNLHVNNSIFRNNQGLRKWWEGVPMMFWAALGDTLSITNSTFFNNTTVVVSNWENHYTKYYKFCHNTVYGTAGVGQSAFAQTHSEISDNLFINTYAMGIDTTGVQHGEGALPGEQTSIIPLSVNDAASMLEKVGVESEADRKVIVRNNIYYWSPEILDYWASRGEQFPPVNENPVFMNQTTQDMFDDETAYPLFDEANNIEVDPKFIDSEMESKVMSGFFERGDILYDSAANGSKFPYVRDPFAHHYPGESGVSNVTVMVEWPLAENLTYTNEELLTASTTGGPVGDPRWFPEEDTTSINTLYSDLTVRVSNYPNPFSNSTTITYSIEKESEINITIFNSVGQEVTVLVNKTQQTGQYSIKWSPNTLPGIYICRVRANNTSNYTKLVYTHK